MKILKARNKLGFQQVIEGSEQNYNKMKTGILDSHGSVVPRSSFKKELANQLQGVQLAACPLLLALSGTSSTFSLRHVFPRHPHSMTQHGVGARANILNLIRNICPIKAHSKHYRYLNIKYLRLVPPLTLRSGIL